MSQESNKQAEASSSTSSPALKTSLVCEIEEHVQNSKHKLEKLTSDPELATIDGQLLFVMSKAIDNLAQSNMNDVKQCQCDKAKYEFRSLKQTTSEDVEFVCGQCAEKVCFSGASAVVKGKTRPRSAIRNFVALSFLVNGQYFKDYERILGTLGVDHVCSAQWLHIVEWIAPYVKQITDWSIQEA